MVEGDLNLHSPPLYSGPGVYEKSFFNSWKSSFDLKNDHFRDDNFCFEKNLKKNLKKKLKKNWKKIGKKPSFFATVGEGGSIFFCDFEGGREVPGFSCDCGFEL